MPSSEDASSAPEPPRRGRGLLARIAAALRPALVGEPVAELEPAAARASEALVGQARAFQSMRVDDIMTPRADVVAVEVSTPFEKLVAQFSETEHSRLPIYRGTLDDPIGFVHIKDVFKLLARKGRRPAAGSAVLRKLMRPAPGVPGSMRAANLLAQMQKSRTHLALVIDEYGGTEGLVTLEDVLEAVVGEIDDEHDVAASAGLRVRPDGVIEANARARLEDLEAALGNGELAPADLEEEIDTVGGLVTALAGRVPRSGEVIRHKDGYRLEVIAADPRRVKRVRIHPRPAPAGEETPPA